MATSFYRKGPLTYVQQLNQLKNRGLIVHNEAKAIHLLEKLSYYRLSGYWHPLLTENKKAHQFKEGATFERAFEIYCFDRKLRRLVFSEIEKIEIAVRSILIYTMSHKHGALWLNDARHFIDAGKHFRLIEDLQRSFNKSDEVFIKAFKANYNDVLPPSWIILEIVSIGALSQLYANLRPSAERKTVAHSFGLSDMVFGKWLHTLTYIRNICAHHTRLWNRTASISSIKPNFTKKQWLNNQDVRNDKLYYALSIILYLKQSIHPTNTLKKKFFDLLDRFPCINLSAMGFPEKFQDEPLWRLNFPL